MERLRILIVDDEEDLVTTLAERLVLRGFEVEAATSGTEALTRVGQDYPSVVLVDLKMPGLDGLGLMAQIKEKHSDLPVILFTGYGSDAEAERGLAEGAVDYVMKPIDIDELIDKIRNAISSERGR